MRIGIREQLAFVVLLAVLTTLAIVSIPVWFVVNGFIGDVKAQALALTASLKAAQVASVLNQLQVISNSMTTRISLQNVLNAAYDGSDTGEQWTDASTAVQTALVASGFVDLLQVRVYDWGDKGPLRTNLLLNVTKPLSTGLELPYRTENGSAVHLGDPGGGYPSMLYPNLTYRADKTGVEAFPGVSVTAANMLLLGPLIVNESYALISISQPVISNRDGKIVGYMTVVGGAQELFKIESSPEGLGKSGLTLMVGPDTPWHRFNSSTPAANNTHSGDKGILKRATAKFILPLVYNQEQSRRHRQPSPGPEENPTFTLNQFPAVLNSYSQQFKSVNNATALLHTTNEDGMKVSTGAARPPTSLVDWIIVVEQTQDEALAPIALLRKILLICVFSTIGLVLVLVLPFAHISVLPIRRLKAATNKFVIPPGYEEQALVREETLNGQSEISNEKRPGLTTWVKEYHRKYSNRPLKGVKHRPEGFIKIPGKIEVKRHVIKDELTDLTITFNDMSDELLRQYTQLEDKVAERTKQLELSKKAAEAANQSKTVFIANVSHELKTPLNGILGMCSVCMEDNDIGRIKQSLKTVYESGTLLLRLLEDLLNFARHEVGQPARLEEMVFSPGDVGKQITAFFAKDAKARGIDFRQTFIDAEPPSHELRSGRLPFKRSFSPEGRYECAHIRGMQVWGDQHRVLQVVINLLTNSFKFTPAGGRVDLRIRFLGEVLASGRSETGDSETVFGSSTNSQKQSQQGSISRRTTPLQPESDATTVAADWSSCWFEFEVEDTGQGIPEPAQKRIFEPFVQGENGLARKYGGTGLGLAICRQLATLMGGSIGVKSTMGVGSTFTMRIPFKVNLDAPAGKLTRSVSLEPLATPKLDDDSNEGSMEETRPASALDYFSDEKRPTIVRSTTNPDPAWSPEPPQLIWRDRRRKSSGLRALLADDNATNLEVLSRMLLLEKVEDVQLAVNGKEAYEKVKADMEAGNHFDIIFMDIQMPEMDGLESTRLIRAMGYSGLVVALSAFAEENMSRQCSEVGVDHYMCKPINRKAVKEALKLFSPTSPETEAGKENSTGSVTIMEKNRDSKS